MSDEDHKTRRTRVQATPRGRVEIVTASETVLWQHAPAAPTRGAGTAPARPQGPHRGRGPRGHVRAPARIYADLCHRLTDNPVIRASGIEVTVRGTRARLTRPAGHTSELRPAQDSGE